MSDWIEFIITSCSEDTALCPWLMRVNVAARVIFTTEKSCSTTEWFS